MDITKQPATINIISQSGTVINPKSYVVSYC